jgi:signal peptidase I
MFLPLPLRSHPQGALSWLCLVLVLVLAVRHWFWMPALIEGASMLPTLKSGQLAGINKLAYLRRPPARGDLVAVWTGKQLLSKRVVGLPGEEISIQQGVLYVNGVPLCEPYVQFFDARQNAAPGRIETNCFVVASDNRPGGIIAVVSRRRIVGRIVTYSTLVRKVGDLGEFTLSPYRSIDHRRATFTAAIAADSNRPMGP